MNNNRNLHSPLSTKSPLECPVQFATTLALLGQRKWGRLGILGGKAYAPERRYSSPLHASRLMFGPASPTYEPDYNTMLLREKHG